MVALDTNTSLGVTCIKWHQTFPCHYNIHVVNDGIDIARETMTSYESLNLGESFFNGIEIGGVWWQVLLKSNTCIK